MEMVEMVILCSEFLDVGSDSTSTALQWIMANIMKHPEIEEKLYLEMKEVAEGKEVIEEEDLQKMPYLKAVVLEGLRRHSPSHFGLPHAVTEEEVELGGYVVPKEASITFMAWEMAMDPKVWKDPMEFKPERFVGSESQVDISGSKEIKMMPFGVGRRMCPAYGLAMLQFGLEVSVDFTLVMKKPFGSNDISQANFVDLI